MIRSSIGIVCVLVLITTCVQSTAAQAHSDYSQDTLQGRDAQSQLSSWIELADRGVSDRVLSSDANHDDFRFRAAPVKQSRNWKMPIVDVRSAKDISTTFKQSLRSGSPAIGSLPTGGIHNTPVVDWVWESSSDLAVRYSELNDPFNHVAMAVIPCPLPTRTKPALAKQMLIADARPAKMFSIELVAKRGTKSPAPKHQTSRGNIATPVVDWVWESSSDLAVRYSELDDPFNHTAMAVIPCPLPTRLAKQMPIADARPAKMFSIELVAKRGTKSTASKAQPSSSTNIAPAIDWVWESSSDLAVQYSELDDPFNHTAMAVIPCPLPTRTKPVKANQLPIAGVRPAKTFSFQLVAKRGVGSLPLNPLPASSDNIAPVLDWVWESPSDLAVRYSELNDPFNHAAMAIIPRPLPAQTKPAKAKQMPITDSRPAKKFSIELVAKKQMLVTSRTDYWTYYADCDRWNVVFAKPNALSPSKRAADQQIVDAKDVDQKKSEITFGLQELAAHIAERWENAMSFYRTVSQRYLIRQS